MYIKKAIAISPQNTYDGSFFEKEAINIKGTKFRAVEPNYEEFIPVKHLRRMGKALRMVIASTKTIFDDKNQFDAIIIGSALGSMEGSIKFIEQIIQYDEGLLTPSGFVSSTANSIAGFLALKTSSTGYNNTHSFDGLSFEGALNDAQLLLEQNDEVNSVLLGAVDEISEFNYNLECAGGYIKNSEDIDSKSLIKSGSDGTVAGEGSTVFCLENNPENALAEVTDFETISYANDIDLNESLNILLDRNSIKIKDIDALVVGRCGDKRFENYYNIFEQKFNDITVYTYKNLVGEYPTSAAFAVWLSTQIINGKKIPEEAIYKKGNKNIKNILIFNNYKNKQHSFILIRAS